MSERRNAIISMFIFLILSVLIVGFQTTFWPMLFSASWTPLLWLLPVIYIGIYKRPVFSIVYCYLNTLFIHTFTGMPFGILLSVQLAAVVTCSFLRKRIFWTSLSYYLGTCVIMITLVETFSLMLSSWVEPLSQSTLEWRQYLTSLASIPLFGLMFFYVGRWIEIILPTSPIEVAQT